MSQRKKNRGGAKKSDKLELHGFFFELARISSWAPISKMSMDLDAPVPMSGMQEDQPTTAT